MATFVEEVKRNNWQILSVVYKQGLVQLACYKELRC